MEKARQEIERIEALVRDDSIVQALKLLYYSRAEDSVGFDRTFQSLSSLTDDPKADVMRLVVGAQMSREPGRAEALYERAIARAPEDPVASGVYAMHLHADGKNERALEVLWKAIARSPDNPALINAAAHVLIESSQADKGIELIRSAIARSIRTDDLHNTLGVGLASVGDHLSATREYRRSIELNPTEPLFFFNLSLALKALKDEEGASGARAEADRLGLDLSAFGVNHSQPVSRVH